MNRASIVVSLVSSACILGAAALLTAGPLDPPLSEVAPTFKTLAEVEPRIPLSLATTPGDADSVFRITQPGSYYLTGDTQGVIGKSGIEIAAGNVTIDLMGFTLRGAPGSHSGIRIVGVNTATLAVRNGVLTGWGREGLDLGSATEEGGSIVEGVVSASNGRVGIQLPDHSIVRNCRASDNVQSGIFVGNRSLVEDCVAHANGNDGISVGFGSVVQGCASTRNQGDGIDVSTACQVLQCSAVENEQDGIDASAGSAVIGNLCESNGFLSADGAGVHITSSDCRVEDNKLNRNDRGLDVDAAGNFIARNTATGNTTNYDVTGVQTIGPIITAAGTITSTNPWANFSF